MQVAYLHYIMSCNHENCLNVAYRNLKMKTIIKVNEPISIFIYIILCLCQISRFNILTGDTHLSEKLIASRDVIM